MEKLAAYDLHLHTEWSYDAFTKVEEYFLAARRLGLRAIAITDHHLMDAYGEVAECARKYPDVRFFSGGELTVHCPFGDIDLVCLNLPIQSTPQLAPLWDAYHQWQRDYGHACSVNLTRLGFDFNDEARLELLKSYRPAKAIAAQGNSHVRYHNLRDECIRRGWCQDEAGYKRLSASFTDMPDYPAYDFVVPMVKQAGGVVILAHPYDMYCQPDDLKHMDELREMLQLDGVECVNGDTPQEAVAIYHDYCRKHGLLSSGGSDLHRPDQIDARFARHCGDEAWLDEMAERITLH